MTNKENSSTSAKSRFTFSMTPANGQLPLRREVESHKLEAEQETEASQGREDGKERVEKGTERQRTGGSEEPRA